MQEFQVQHQLKVTGIVDRGTAKAINDALTVQGELTPPPPGPIPQPNPNPNPSPNPNPNPTPIENRVTGTIVHSDGTPVVGLLVRAYHRQLGGEQQLGDNARSHAKGHYEITYRRPPLIEKIDLFVRAFDNKNQIVGVSAILIGAPGEAVRDLTVSAPELRGPFARRSLMKCCTD